MRGELIALVPISFQFDFRNDIRFFGERKELCRLHIAFVQSRSSRKAGTHNECIHRQRVRYKGPRLQR
jgi:hypothetical protein